MKKEDVSILLIILMFVAVGFVSFMGWLSIEEQNISFNNLRLKQYTIVRKVNSLNDSMVKLNWQIKDTISSLNNLKTAMNSDKISIKEVSSRIDKISNKLSTWQIVSKGVMSQLDRLNAKVKLSENAPVKNNNLGKVSVEKDIAQNTQEKSTE